MRTYMDSTDFPGGSVVNTPTQEIWVQSLGWEDPLEEEKATHSSILAWEIPWTEKQWPQDWKRSVFIPIQRKAMPKNAQTTAQLHSSHTLVK